MKKTHRFLACTVAAILTFGMPAQAFEPALDPLPDLSSYPTQLLVDGQAVKQGAMPQYIEGTAQLPLRNILEQAGYKVDWNAQNQSAVFSKNDMETYRLSSSTGALTQNGAVLWTDSKITVAKGTTYVSANLFDYVEGITADWDGATNTAIITTEAPRDNVYCYDLGEGTLTQGTREIPYRMQGVIGVPEGQNRPVVIFLHGAHPIQSAAENRYDLGFSYLVDQLADAGYLALSMNVGINYSFENGEPNGCQRTVQVVEQQSALLKQAIEGKNGIFPCDLKNKGDLNQVILVGHSRAGYDIFEVADQTELLGIQGLISAAPSLVSPLSGAPVDVPAGIIIPQYDGDVTSLDGGMLFDQLENTSQRSSGTDLIYLENGNHGGFSTALVRPDPFADRDTLLLVMEPEKQQAFFSAYAMDFVKTVLATGKTPLETVATLPEQYAGYPIMARVDAGGDVLYRAAVDSVEDLQTADAAAEGVNACSTLDHTAGSFRIPGSFMQYDLTRIRWEKAGSTVTIPVLADLRQASYLQIYHLGCTVLVYHSRSFDIVIRNIRRVKELYPEYASKMMISTVVSPKYELNHVLEYFDSDEVLSDTNIIMTPLAEAGLKEKVNYKDNFYQVRRFEYLKLLLHMIGKIDQKYVSRMVLNSRVQMERLYRNLQRHAQISKSYHPGGPCIPSVKKIFIMTDGRIFPCEKVPQSTRCTQIGTLDTGFDLENMKKILNIGSLTAEECKQCWALPNCSICAAELEYEEGQETFQRADKLKACEDSHKRVIADLYELCVLHEFGYRLNEEGIIL